MESETEQASLAQIAQSVAENDPTYQPPLEENSDDGVSNDTVKCEMTTAMFIPEEHDVPQYHTIHTEESLLAYTEAYALWAIQHHEMGIDSEYITDYNIVDTKRKAASVSRLEIPDAYVGTIGINTIDWENLLENVSTENIDREHPKEVSMSFSWNAFQEFNEDTWKEIIKHELIHIEEFHQYGDTNHRSHFKNRAREINAALKIPQFSDPEYVLLCSECTRVVGGRHRRSKVVKSAEQEDGKYTSNCCNAPLSTIT